MGVKVAAKTTSAEAPKIDGGMYDARFDGVEAKADVPSQYGDSDVFIWAFTLFEDGEPMELEDDPEPVTVEAMTSQSTNTKSKTTPRAVRFLKAIMTSAEFAAFENEEEEDTDELVGRMVQVIIEIKENGWPKVTDVLPKKKASRRAAAAE